jgi:hypothetical protein
MAIFATILFSTFLIFFNVFCDILSPKAHITVYDPEKNIKKGLHMIIMCTSTYWLIFTASNEGVHCIEISIGQRSYFTRSD